MGRELYVGNLLFERRTRGVAWVEMSTDEEAQKAIANLHHLSWGARADGE